MLQPEILHVVMCKATAIPLQDEHPHDGVVDVVIGGYVLDKFASRFWESIMYSREKVFDLFGYVFI